MSEKVDPSEVVLSLYIMRNGIPPFLEDGEQEDEEETKVIELPIVSTKGESSSKEESEKVREGGSLKDYCERCGMDSQTYIVVHGYLLCIKCKDDWDNTFEPMGTDFSKFITQFIKRSAP